MKRKKFTIILSLLILLQPILDLYFIAENPHLEIFGFKVVTLIRYGIIFIMGILIIINTKLKTWRKSIIVYFILLVLYVIAHTINASNFNTLYPDGISFNLFEELFYIARYIIPIIIIYYIYTLELNENIIKKVLVIYCLIISIISVVTNVFYIAHSSYSNSIILFNIVDWFTKDINYLYAASKGLFTAASTITTLLIITPYIYSCYYNEKKKVYLITVVLNMLALFIVGTRACSYGFILLTLGVSIMYLFFSLIKKNIKFNFKLVTTSIVLIITSLLLFNVSPAINRVDILKSADENIESSVENSKDEFINKKDDVNNTLLEEDIPNKFVIRNIEEMKKMIEEYPNSEKEIVISYISSNQSYLDIYAPFLERYNYRYDYQFWMNIILNEPDSKKSDNRYIEELMLKRVKEINNNQLDDYLGITYSRTSKIFNLERDFIYQYYSIGILGIILLIFPIIIFLIMSILKILFEPRNFNLENCCLCMGVGLILAISVYSGDVLDNIATNAIIAVILGLLIKKVFDKNNLKGE